AKRGDPQLRFFPEDFFPGLTDKERRDSYRLGVRHAFSPGSIVIGSVIYQDADFSTIDKAPPAPPELNLVDLERHEHSIGFQLQHQFRSRYFNLISGVGYVNIDGQLDSTFGLNLPPPPDGPGPQVVQNTDSTDLKHTNLYAYGYINLLRNLTLTVGASADF